MRRVGHLPRIIDTGCSVDYIVSNGQALSSNHLHQIPEFIISTQTEEKLGRGTIWSTYVPSCQNLANDHSSRIVRHSTGRTWTRFVCMCVCVCVCVSVCVV